MHGFCWIPLRTPAAFCIALAAPVLALFSIGGAPAQLAEDGPLVAQLRARIERSGTLVVGHRGAAATHPENTMLSFRAAIDAGADLIELDFRESADGILFCLHDESLDRTTDARSSLGEKQRASDHDFERLSTLDAGSWKDPRFHEARIPTLSSVLTELADKTVLMLEHKHGSPDTLVRLLHETKTSQKVLVQSFDWKFLIKVHALDPKISLGALGSEALTDARLDQIERTGACFVHWRALDLADLATLRRVRDRGLLLITYTINDLLPMAGAAALGLDGVTTDHPSRLRDALRALDG